MSDEKPTSEEKPGNGKRNITLASIAATILAVAAPVIEARIDAAKQRAERAATVNVKPYLDEHVDAIQTLDKEVRELRGDMNLLRAENAELKGRLEGLNSVLSIFGTRRSPPPGMLPAAVEEAMRDPLVLKRLKLEQHSD